MASTLISQRQDRTLVLTLSDPATRNTLSPQVYAAALEALESAEGNAEVRCVVLRGDGEHFCAGGDLNRLARTREQGADLAGDNVERFHALVEALHSFPKPVIAAVEGFAAGGGCSLALACDLIVASDSARFVMSYGRAGLSSDGGGLWQLLRCLPRAQVLKFLWLPEPQTARDWLAAGLVAQVTDTGHALPEALRLAERLAAMAPNALASVKELANDAPARTLRQHLDGEREHFVRNLLHPNAGEGVKAFFDKRAPRFDDV
jgi:enoyl-CoA hydratase/carnithine racemase